MRLFNFITGYAQPEGLEKLVVLADHPESDLLRMIGAEIDNAKAGKPAAIWAKLNSLVDPVIIDALYRASQGACRSTW